VVCGGGIRKNTGKAVPKTTNKSWNTRSRKSRGEQPMRNGSEGRNKMGGGTQLLIWGTNGLRTGGVNKGKQKMKKTQRGDS